MPTRPIALALLFLICAPPAGGAAEQAGTTVVLQLPPSMSPDQVKGLIADLAAKGAEPVAAPADPPEAAAPTLMTGMKLTVRIWGATKQAVRAVPTLFQVPQVWVRQVGVEGGTRDAALRFWAIALAVLVAAPLIGQRPGRCSIAGVSSNRGWARACVRPLSSFWLLPSASPFSLFCSARR